jgi:hypothetical protein
MEVCPVTAEGIAKDPRWPQGWRLPKLSILLDCATALLTKVIEATDVTRRCPSMDATPRARLRLDASEDVGLVAVIAPNYWRDATWAARPRERPVP